MCVLLVVFLVSGSTYIDIAHGNSAGHFCGIVGGVEGETVRWVIDCRSVTVGKLEFVVLRLPRIGELFFGVGLVALAGKPYASD